ncbi:hypothetical protein NMY22_g3399 [Coprinellus aureogranulatus]|nr:hypothetical protein NMY22_g3399 [Coprinellus aureogranulatus]
MEETASAQQTIKGALDPEFCSDMAVFQVESTIFRVLQREIAAASPIFRTMFTLPKGDLGKSQAVEGSVNENPIVLEGHKAADFNALLRVLYPTSRDLLQGGPTLNKDQWIGVLGLSTIWEMQEVRELAISKLSDQHLPQLLTAVEKVNLGRTYRVSSWLINGLMDLTWAEKDLSPEALGEAVGLPTALRICSARLRKLSQYSRIVPVEVLSKLHVGFCISAICCSFTKCLKPMVKGKVASCSTCSREFVVNAVGSIFTPAAPQLHLGPEIYCPFFLIPVPDLRCTAWVSLRGCPLVLLTLPLLPALVLGPSPCVDVDAEADDGLSGSSPGAIATSAFLERSVEGKEERVDGREVKV